jgi:hypothetical protein
VPSARRPRRAAFELAVRTFAATEADLVVVSLPTLRPVLVILERSQFPRSLGPAFIDALTGIPSLPTAKVRCVVDNSILPHLYVPMGLQANTQAEDTFAVLPLSVTAPRTRAGC